MRIKCDYCGNYIDDADAFCGHCGAPNDQMQRSANGIPKTVAELQDFCRQHDLPLKQMRFFIGENYQGARAYGIYQADDGDFVVYKNKSDGSRSVRYEGKDEAYAVNEIYQKLKTEMTTQKQARTQGASSAPPASPTGRSAPASGKKKKGRGCLKGCLIAIIAFIFLIVIGLILESMDHERYDSPSGYGQSQWGDDYDGSDSGGSWLWDDDSGSSWDNDSGSSFWDFWDSWDDDWDSSDWDWDSGSDWDSGWSDWDSDW